MEEHWKIEKFQSFKTLKEWPRKRKKSLSLTTLYIRNNASLETFETLKPLKYFGTFWNILKLLKQKGEHE